MILLILGGLICIVVGLYIYARWNFGTLEKLGIPVVEHHPLLGSVKEMYKEVGALNDIKWMNKYGPVFGVYEGRYPHIYICDPELVRLICIKDADHFNGKRPLDFGDPVLNEMPDFQPLGKWKLIRTFLTPAFSSSKIRSMNTPMRESIKEYVADLKESIKKTKKGVLEKVAYTFPFLRKFLPSSILNAEAVKRFSIIFKQMMEQRRKSGEKKNDVVDMCIEWADKLDTPKMREEGITTTLYYIATNPEIAKKAYAEVDAVFQRNNGIITHESIPELVYINVCINESLRLYPFFYRTERECTKEWRNEKYNLTVKKGMIIQLPSWAANRNPEYNEDPEKYDPERWMPENKDRINVYSSTSFGHGPRNCIGKSFSTEAMPLLAAYMLRELKFVGRKDSEIKFKPGGPFF
ncbi:unnamed protein product [Orchesella dallaii]|uniref:Cytochrome P450 n=1 Tax=Orchesella dallaii TaxID=48710 RepID=A0ABP1QJS1_9HEXA